jgi:DNA-binding transcriptional ArsR family regulator
MAQSLRSADGSPDAGTDCDPPRALDDVDTGTLLSLLGDDYARELLAALSTAPKTAPTLIEECEASKPTVYRRLDALEEAGLVETDTAVDPDGYHCKRFHPTVSAVTLSLDECGVAATVDDPADVPRTSRRGN